MRTIKGAFPSGIGIFGCLVALGVVFTGCVEEFDPASKVEKLRLLALRSDPPEIAPDYAAGTPAGEAELGALVGHPSFALDPARRATVVHLTCTPSPDNLVTSPCTTIAMLGDPTLYVAQIDLAAACAAPGMGTPGGISFSGVESCGAEGCERAEVLRDPADSATLVALPMPRYVLPGSLGLDSLADGTPERVLGVEVVDLALVLDASPAELSPATAVGDDCTALAAFLQRFMGEWEGREHVAGIKRIQVRGPDATDEPNRNPAISGILLENEPLPLASSVVAQADVNLVPELPGDGNISHQQFTRYDTTGAAISSEVEEWTFAWFATAGDLEDLYTSETEAEIWNIESPSPEGGKVLLYSVVYDSRGGTNWVIRDVTVVPVP